MVCFPLHVICQLFVPSKSVPIKQNVGLEPRKMMPECHHVELTGGRLQSKTSKAAMPKNTCLACNKGSLCPGFGRFSTEYASRRGKAARADVCIVVSATSMSIERKQKPRSVDLKTVDESEHASWRNFEMVCLQDCCLRVST